MSWVLNFQNIKIWWIITTGFIFSVINQYHPSFSCLNTIFYIHINFNGFNIFCWDKKKNQYHPSLLCLNTYRISAVLKVKTDIITCITESLIGQAAILMVMYVETFKTDVIVFIDNVIMCLMTHWPIISSIRVSLLILTISLGEIKRKKWQITNKIFYIQINNHWFYIFWRDLDKNLSTFLICLYVSTTRFYM